MTGRESTFIKAQDADFVELKNHLDDGKAIIARTYDKLINPPNKIAGNHSYVIQYIDTQTQIITLYNPWSKDDGVVITFDQFKTYYESISINDLN